MTTAAAGVAARCQVCHAEIWWALTCSGKRIPIDTVPTDRGNVVIERRSGDLVEVRVLGKNTPRPPDQPVYMPHFATCKRRLRVLQGGRS